MHKLALLPAFLLLLYGFAPAAATPPSLPAHALFHLSWSGITLGYITINTEMMDDKYHVEVRITSEGIMNLFKRHESHTIAEGLIQNERYVPQRYDSRYSIKKKPKRVTMLFGAKGNVKEEILEPPRKEDGRPEATAEQKRGALDFGTAFLELRRLIHAAQPSFSFPVYDGRRLFTVQFDNMKKTRARVRGSTYDVITMRGKRQGIAGFTGKEQKEMKKDPRVYIYVSDDGKFRPLMVEVDLLFGTLRAELVRECATAQDCLPR